MLGLEEAQDAIQDLGFASEQDLEMDEDLLRSDFSGRIIAHLDGEIKGVMRYGGSLGNRESMRGLIADKYDISEEEVDFSYVRPHPDLPRYRSSVQP